VKDIIATGPCPQAIGPLFASRARRKSGICVRANFQSTRRRGNFVAGGIAEQTEQVLRNLTAVFEAAGLSLNQVVKTTVFLVDMDDFTGMNEVYGRFFGQQPPARATVQAAVYREMPGLRLKLSQ